MVKAYAIIYSQWCQLCIISWFLPNQNHVFYKNWHVRNKWFIVSGSRQNWHEGLSNQPLFNRLSLVNILSCSISHIKTLIFERICKFHHIMALLGCIPLKFSKLYIECVENFPKECHIHSISWSKMKEVVLIINNIFVQSTRSIPVRLSLYLTPLPWVLITSDSSILGVKHF